MQRTTFVKLSALAFALVLVGFLVRGFSGLVLPTRTAAMLSAPSMLAGGLLIVVLTAYSALVVSGIQTLE